MQNKTSKPKGAFRASVASPRICTPIRPQNVAGSKGPSTSLRCACIINDWSGTMEKQNVVAGVILEGVQLKIDSNSR